MYKKITDTTLINEEKRTIKWFLTLFYIISISYDLFYYYIFPKYIFHTDIGLTNKLGYWIYLLMFSLIPLAWYLFKTGRQSKIKYVYFICYSIIIIADDLLTYLGSSLNYESGNAVEVFFILFSPIFINRHYYWLVLIGTSLKYLVISLVLNTTEVFVPLILVIVLAIVAYIFLNRFTGYVRAIEDSFDKQLQGIVKGVIATLELKDPYTRGHSERVSYYALALAKEMGKFSSQELKEFNYACLLHDVGKIHIPDQILMKPNNLTTEEYEIIKTHPEVGAEAVDGVKD